MAHISINMEDMPIQVLDFEPVNPLISKCNIKICYVGQKANRNRSVITKETASEIAKSVPGCPIVGYYNEAKGDFEEHNRIIDISNGKFNIKDTTRPYGFVSMDAKVWFQWFEDDGEPHEYLCTEGYIWTGQYPESQRVITKGNNQSMELDENTLDAFWTKDNNGKPQFFIINEAIMSKLCILGEDVEPCFEGASITNVQFSFEDNFKQKLYSLMETMQEILSNEGGTPVLNIYAVEIGSHLWDAIYDYIWAHCRTNQCDLDMYIDGIYEEGSQKFAILRNRKDLTYYRLDFSLTEDNGFIPAQEMVKVSPDFKPAEQPQFSLEDIEAFEVAYKKKKEEEEKPTPGDKKEEGENKGGSAPAKEEDTSKPKNEDKPSESEDKNAESTDKEKDDEDKKKKKTKYNLEEVVEYQELLTKYNVLEQTNSELQATISKLTQEKDELVKFKNQIDREKKETLIKETFFMLSDEQKKDCIDNIDTYSLDEIEAKLSVICVRNKVSFNLDSKDEEEDKTTTYNLNEVQEEDADIPDWIKRVAEVKKEKNL